MSGLVFLILRILLAAILYTFLGWAFWLLWQDLKQRRKQLISPQAPSIVLEVSDMDTRQVQRFNSTEIIIGRDPSCDCALDNTTISSRHARLSFHHNQWWVEDLGSRNGTFLNQNMVNRPLVLTSGDLVSCGQVQIGIKIEVENREGS